MVHFILKTVGAKVKRLAFKIYLVIKQIFFVVTKQNSVYVQFYFNVQMILSTAYLFTE